MRALTHATLFAKPSVPTGALAFQAFGKVDGQPRPTIWFYASGSSALRERIEGAALQLRRKFLSWPAKQFVRETL
eukprot:1971707-Pleurochrysis_carterae.AAC.3